jgi:hypothetical protein
VAKVRTAAFFYWYERIPSGAHESGHYSLTARSNTMTKLTEVQQKAFDRILTLRDFERRTGSTFGPIEKRVLADLGREDIVAVVDALIEAGGVLAGFNTLDVAK